MKSNRLSKSNHTTVFGVGVGIIVSLVISMLLLTGVTSLIVDGKLNENVVAFFTFATRVIALLVGVLIGTGLIKQKHIIFAGVIALGYLIILITLGIVLYDGSFRNFGSGIVSVLLGSGAGCLIRLKLQNRPQRAKRIKN